MHLLIDYHEKKIINFKLLLIINGGSSLRAGWAAARTTY